MKTNLQNVADIALNTLVCIYHNEDDLEISCKASFEDKKKLCYLIHYIMPFVNQNYLNFFIQLMYMLTNNYFRYGPTNYHKRQRVS